MSQREVSSLSASVASLRRRISDLETELDRRLNDHAARHLTTGGDPITATGLALDHGSLTGLGDDDHTQYLLAAGDTLSGALKVVNSFGDVGGHIYALDTSTRDVLKIDASSTATANDGPRLLLYGPGDASFAKDVAMFDEVGATIWRWDESDDRLEFFKGLSIEGKLGLGSPPTLNIASGILTVAAAYHGVLTESSASTDSVTGLTGGIIGDIVVFRHGTSSQTITWVHASTMALTGSTNATTSSSRDTITFICIGTDTWVEAARSIK